MSNRWCVHIHVHVYLRCTECTHVCMYKHINVYRIARNIGGNKICSSVPNCHLANFNLAAWYGIAIRIIYGSKKFGGFKLGGRSGSLPNR